MHTKIFKYVRTALLLLLLAVVLVHSVLWVIGAIGAYRRGMFLVDVEDFSDCKDSFDLLSEKWLPYYEAAKESEEDLLTLSIRHNFSHWTIQFEYEDPARNRAETVAMTPEEAEAVKQVNQGLSNDYTKGEAPPFLGKPGVLPSAEPPKLYRGIPEKRMVAGCHLPGGRGFLLPPAELALLPRGHRRIKNAG